VGIFPFRPDAYHAVFLQIIEHDNCLIFIAVAKSRGLIHTITQSAKPNGHRSLVT